MRDTGLPADKVRELLHAARARDTPFASGRILGSMCTAPHPLAIEAYKIFLETNLGDPHLCSGAKQLEDEALASLGALLHAPPATRGVFVTGGSEANFTGALVCMRKRPGANEIVLPDSAHFSFDKTATFLGLKQVFARTLPDGTVDLDDVRERIGPKTACVVGIAGTTELGVVDPLPEIAALCNDLRVPLHVDAAFGGFVIPFAKRLGKKLPDFDLALDGVTTLAIDPHKMGMAAIPSGVLFAREGNDFAPLATPSPYVSVERQPTIQGTRPGAAAASTWAVMEGLGVEGYTNVVRNCLDVTRHLVGGLEAAGFPPVQAPTLNIAAFRVADPPEARKRLRERGFLISLAPISRGLKVVAMPHVTREAIDAFLPVLADIAEAN